MIRISGKKGSIGIFLIVIILIFPWAFPITQAQTDINFTPADEFSVAAYNGTISFAVNGTYSNATLNNGIWTFMNLRLNGSEPLQNFSISAQNCNVTLFFYHVFNSTSFHIVLLNYWVEGQGEQILNLGLGRQEEVSNANLDWSVIVRNNVFLAEGEAWNISKDGTMMVTDAIGNVSVVHWDFFDSNGNGIGTSNLPFYQQHSVAIATVLGAAAIVSVAVVMKVLNQSNLTKNKQVKNAS